MTIVAIAVIFICFRVLQVINGFLFALILENKTGIWIVIASVAIMGGLHLVRVLLPESKATRVAVVGIMAIAGAALLAGPQYLGGFFFAVLFYVLIGAEHKFYAALEAVVRLPAWTSNLFGAALFVPAWWLGRYLSLDVEAGYVAVFAVAELVLLMLWMREAKDRPEDDGRMDPPLFMALPFLGFPIGFYFAFKANGQDLLEAPLVLNILGALYVAGMMIVYLAFSRWVFAIGKRRQSSFLSRVDTGHLHAGPD